ncbi:diguanylate cyclase [Aureimonas jatrophae]|uniref:diguanylate cyclase n=1 Tax=Aureimonas jatrophae TaxID=1166073 RepID=UPI00147ECD9D|nr:diguanylate cyclase (GGDEF)-like protein [Aureimonas jatrophae]
MLPIEIVAVSADTLFALAFYHYASALLVRFGGPVVSWLRLVLLVISIAAPAIGVLWIGTLQAELIASDVTCSLQLALALVLIPLWPKSGINRAIVALSWFNIVDNLIRTASIPFTTGGTSFDTFLGSEYGYLMQATAMVTGFAFAILALASIMSDVVAAHRRDALIDPLTGLLNRRGLEVTAGPGQAGRPDSVISVDLDHFKRVNDTYGHEVGDRVLVAFADLIHRTLPRGCAGARVGGEEFVVWLPGRTMSQAEMIAVRLRASMAAHDWTEEGIDERQTASFGLGLRLGEGADETLAAAIRRADIRLYEAKRTGRDRIRGQVAA